GASCSKHTEYASSSSGSPIPTTFVVSFRGYSPKRVATTRRRTSACCAFTSIEGATCGPDNFAFRFGADVIRTADLPRDVAVVLSGHIHRHPPARDARGR